MQPFCSASSNEHQLAYNIRKCCRLASGFTTNAFTKRFERFGRRFGRFNHQLIETTLFALILGKKFVKFYANHLESFSKSLLDLFSVRNTAFAFSSSP